MTKALLTLEDGTIFTGFSGGVSGIVCGELVFNTSMTGYQEMLTDCSYAGQLLVLTYPHIGNVGVNKYDMESNQIWVEGLVVRDLSSVTSNWRAEQSLRNFLKKNDTIAITGLDTRALTHKLRKNGSMIGCIATGKVTQKEIHSKIMNFKELNVNHLDKSSEKINFWPQISNPRKEDCLPLYHVVVYDFGVKLSILKFLKELGCRITVVSGTTKISDLMKLKPEGILLSNGPGDPKSYIKEIDIIRDLLDIDVPILGICLGHQLLALASGGSTVKMHYGHHGANHPVQEVKSGKVLITSQNHNFTVDNISLPQNWIITHRSLFDGTVQGVCHTDKPIYGFQGHPEASPGPHEARIIFESFVNLIKRRRLLCPNEQI